ncbi:MAG TPA: GGDEF and EAL domain-containing protein [Coleofasciculaceae cyanobacterium]
MITSSLPEPSSRSSFNIKLLPAKYWWQCAPVILATLVVVAFSQSSVCQALESLICAALLHGDQLVPDPALQKWLWPLLLLTGLGLGFWLPRWRFRYQLATWMSLCAGWIILSWTFWQMGYWMPVTSPILLFGLCGGSVALAEAVRTYILLRQSETRYALAVRGTTEGLWDWDLQNNCIDFSPPWKAMLGYGEWELSSSPAEWLSRVHPLDVETVKLAIADHCQGLTSRLECEYRLLHRDGSYRWMQSQGSAVCNRKGKIDRIVGSQTDITERHAAELALRRTVFYDPLTELLNRAGFLHRLQQALVDVQTHSNIAFAVLWLDFDQFKLVNNSLGNALGDRLLAAAAQRLKAFLMPENYVARLGGDEFAILLPQIQTTHDATRMAERLQQLLALPFNLDGHEVFTTLSVGIVLSSPHYTQAEHVLRDADTAMHRAKALGRARYQVFEHTMRTRMLLKLQLENDLRRAITQGEHHANIIGVMPNEFSSLLWQSASLDRLAVPTEVPGVHQELQLYYQPIICLTTGLVIGFEALARWKHPEQGFLRPAQFIPLAEETGLIVPLSWWVLRSACRQMRQWQLAFPEQDFLTLSVNLSSQQFAMPELVEQIQQILRETTLSPASLKLEMTEGMVMENADGVVDMLYQIRALGIQLAIDDFGTGYSSLSYLPRFPINTLKIDRSFVSQMHICVDSLEIVRTILVLAHNLGIDVTAEGVETSEQKAQLLEMNCEFGQGYYFSEPLEAKAVIQFLERQQP